MDSIWEMQWMLLLFGIKEKRERQDSVWKIQQKLLFWIRERREKQHTKMLWKLLKEKKRRARQNMENTMCDSQYTICILSIKTDRHDQTM